MPLCDDRRCRIKHEDALEPVAKFLQGALVKIETGFQLTERSHALNILKHMNIYVFVSGAHVVVRLGEQDQGRPSLWDHQVVHVSTERQRLSVLQFVWKNC